MGEMERRSSRTCGWSRGSRGWPDGARRREARGGGGSGRRRRRSGGRGGGERVRELHYGEVKLAAVSIGGEEGRRRGLRVELWACGSHGGGGGALAVLCDGDWVGEDQEAEGERFGASVRVGGGRTEEVDGELVATLMACGVLSVRSRGLCPVIASQGRGWSYWRGWGCWWRAALKASRGQWLGQACAPWHARLSPRRRRGAPSKPSRGAARRSCVAAMMGWEGRSAGRASEALMARQYSPGRRSELRQA